MKSVFTDRIRILLPLLLGLGIHLACQRTASVKMQSIGDPQAASNREPPEVLFVSATNANGSYKTGDTLTIIVHFSKVVVVKGDNDVKLHLATGDIERDAVYQTGSGSDTLSLAYKVQTGDYSADLQYTGTDAMVVGTTTSILDEFDHDAVLTLPALDAAESLGKEKKLVIGTVKSVVDHDAGTGDDYGISFEKSHYQTRSIKRLLIPSQHVLHASGQMTVLFAQQPLACTVTPSYSSPFVASNTKTAQIDFTDGNELQTLLAALTYGSAQKITLSLEGSGVAANTSTDEVTIEDFEAFGLAITSFTTGAQVDSGFQGWTDALSGSVYSDESVINVGFHDMINY